MNRLAGFIPVGVTTADSLSRIQLDGDAVQPDQEYLVRRNDVGEFLLTPAAGVAARELELWRNPELLASVVRGLEQASAEAERRDAESYAAEAADPEWQAEQARERVGRRERNLRRREQGLLRDED